MQKVLTFSFILLTNLLSLLCCLVHRIEIQIYFILE